MTVHLYSLCWNEADMLPFFFRHYDQWVDRYFIYDDGSDDGSLDLLRAHPKVEVRRFRRAVEGAFVLSQAALQNTAWKWSRGSADWIVVTALDEHLFVRGRQMTDYLREQRERGATYIPALGFDTIGDEFPQGNERLVDVAARARPSFNFNKLSIFDPTAVVETSFSPGRHVAYPTGRLVLPARDDLLLYHFKNLGYARTRDRQRAQGERLGAVDQALGHGSQYFWDEGKFQSKWDQALANSIDLKSLPDDASLVADRPIWWRE